MKNNHEERPIAEVLKSRELIEFIKRSDDFINFIEHFKPNDADHFLAECQKHLFVLYNTGLSLPWIELKSNITFTEQLDDQEFNKVQLLIEDRLDKNRYYWHIYNPLDHKDKKVCGDLLDDLSDIYVDLKYSRMIYDLKTDDSIENAIWEFKSNFDMHWGWHCINAIYALHYYLKGK